MCVPAFLVFFRSILNWSLEPKHPMLTHYHVFSSPANDFHTNSIFVNYFHVAQNQYMLFWLLKDA